MEQQKPKQPELFPIVCECQDDNGHVCGRVMSKEELVQDNMCSRCADGLWASVYTSGPTFIHEETLTRS